MSMENSLNNNASIHTKKVLQRSILDNVDVKLDKTGAEIRGFLVNEEQARNRVIVINSRIKELTRPIV